MLRPLALSMLVALACTTLPALAADMPFLHPLFSDNMVLQRGIAAPIWGWTTPGAKVTVAMDGKSATATAGQNGKWMARLGPFEAGGPYDLTVTGPKSVTLRNVLAGDVWICSGQSNMQMQVGSSNNAQAEIAAANLPLVRLFTVPNVTALEPQALVSGAWQPCTPQTVGGFTAAGFFFGRHLAKELGVPIGLINSSWGGTIAEAWTSAEALRHDMPDFVPAVKAVEKLAQNVRVGQADYAKLIGAWYKQNDPGSARGLGYADPALDAAAWPAAEAPRVWEEAGLPGFDGVAWYRKTVELPAAWAGKEAVLRLGPIDDRDTTWVNGVLVGAKDEYNLARDYAVPAGVLKAGPNTIAIRVLDTGGGGGLYGKPEDLRLTAAGVAPVSLAGAWRLKATKPLAEATPLPLRADNNPNVVTVLYNAMIAPLVPYGIRGAIWYQGESNADRAEQYGRLLPTLIRDWRARFGVGDFGFYIVQLANFMQQDAEPRDDPWPHLREAQVLTTKRVPNAGLACIIDIGDAGDIHPKNKQDVGLRLALNALALTYGRNVEYSGPTYHSMRVLGNKIRISFDHRARGLVAKGGKLTGFAIAGADGRFVWADAAIVGDGVMVSSPLVANPVAVRYAWANNPVCSLYNAAGLPAVPFRTDGPAE